MEELHKLFNQIEGNILSHWLFQIILRRYWPWILLTELERRLLLDLRDQVPVHEAISHLQKQTKEHVRNFIQAQLGTYEPLLSMPTIKMNKLVWSSHVMWQQPLQYHPARHI